MYNPSRGGVRGGADQFTWESVKTDKHRENYLGHSLKAPVGRWQKGKDLSWYAKERNDAEDAKTADKSELAAIKRAEQEAMLIALGHNIIRKENQSLTKEEMTEALKRNIGDRDQLNIERVDGVGAKGGRASLLTSSRSKNEGVTFETQKDRAALYENSKSDSPSDKRSKNKKKSKKHKKEKKKKSHKDDSDDSENENQNDRSERDHNINDSGDEISSRHRHKKEKKTKKRIGSSDSARYQDKSSFRRKYRNEETKKRHDTEESNESEEQSNQRHKQRNEVKRRHDTSSSDEPSISDFNKREKKEKLDSKHYKISDDDSDNHSKTRFKHKISKKENDCYTFNTSKHEKKSKYEHQNADDYECGYHENRKEKYKNRDRAIHVKRHRHDTSESD